MAEQARKHELVVVVGVRNIDQQQPESQIEPSRRRAKEVNETSSSVDITYENDRLVVNQVDEEQQQQQQQQTSGQYHHHHEYQGQYVNMEQDPPPEASSSSQQQMPEPATRIRRQHHLEELAEADEEQDEEEEPKANQNYDNEDHYLAMPSQQEPAQRENVTTSQEMALEQQLSLLRDLLRIERNNSEQRRHNNYVLQKYIDQLQADYLRQQSDLVQALEFSHKLKGQKDAQLACLETSVRESESLIRRLNEKLSSLDETKLREEFKQTLDKQLQLKQVEQEQLRAQVVAMEHQLASEQTRVAQQACQHQEKLDDQLRLHEKEVGALKARLVSVQEDLERVLGEPQNLVIRALREDKSQLSTRADELQLAIQESQAKYDSIKRRLDELLAEHRRAAEQHQAELDQAQAHQGEQRRVLKELKLDLEDKEEVNQILQFNLSRSEKRAKNLLGSLKAKEATYRELIGAHGAKQQVEVERLKSELQAQEKRLVELESELGKKQNELVRLQLDQENQLESLRNDRDERLRKLTQEKSALERDQQATELRCARELEQARETSKQVDQLRGELEQLRAECKRISIELTKSEAKLYAKQQELNQVSQRMQELEQQQAAACNSGSDQQVDRLARELDVEQNLSSRLRGQLEECNHENEKLCMKLKIAETNVDKMSTVLRCEHAKMMLEYEKRLEQIRSEQVAFDRNKLRYKRYGYKLKRYCEHLKRVHEHLCSPANCGYAITSPSLQATDQRVYRVSQLSCGAGDSDESQNGYEEIYEKIDEGSPSPATLKSQLSGRVTTRHSPDRYLIKRTGVTSASPQQQANLKASKSALHDASRQHHQYPRTPLKPRNHHQQQEQSLKADNDHQDLFARSTPATVDPKQPRRPSSWQANENQDDRHAYYYIRTDSRLGTPTPTPPPVSGARRTSATPRSLTPAACRQTKLSLARAKVRQQKQQQQQHQHQPEPRACRAVI